MADFRKHVTTKVVPVPVGSTGKTLDIAVHSALTNDAAKPTLIFVHGNSMSSKTYDAQFTDQGLNARYNVVAIDLPGHGDSADAGDLSEEVYAIDKWPAFLAATVEAAGLHDGRSIMIGWSLGGHLALRCIPLLPKLGGFGAHGSPPFGNPLDFTGRFHPHESMTVLFKPEKYTMEDAKLRVEGQLAPGFEGHQFMFDDCLRRDPDFSRVFSASFGASKVSEIDIMKTTDKPVLLLHGDRDVVVSGEFIKALIASTEFPTLFGKELKTIASAGHCPQLETPAEFNAIVGQFADHILAKQ
ncbi:Alpha/Beta hydrolase protein [Hyaloraphidium curvatum]|nr:Alpha/Beta hydrolase protein [Hyaloraphidium curvatum]